MLALSRGGLKLTNIALDGHRYVINDKDERTYGANAEGGLVAARTGTELTITTGAILRNSYSSNRGGAVKVFEGSTLYMNGGAQILNSYGSHGGGIHAGDSNAKVYITGSATVDHCDAWGCGGAMFLHASQAEITPTGTDKVTISNCTAGEYKGGAITVGYAGGSLKMSGDVEITGCSAPDGGAIAIEGNADAKAEIGAGVSIHDNTATKQGGAIAVQSDGNGSALTMTGGTITGNSAGNGGAVDIGAKSKVYFSGDAVIYDNKDAGGNQKNVVLEHDDNGIINVTSDGLKAAAKIGVYVTGEPAGDDEELTQFDKHGVAGTPFGTFAKADNLDRFYNDRKSLTGTRNEYSAEDTAVYWSDGATYICIANRSSVDGLYFKLTVDGGAYGENIFKRGSDEQSPIKAKGSASAYYYVVGPLGGSAGKAVSETYYLPYGAGLSYSVEVYEGYDKSEGFKNRIGNLTDKNITAENAPASAQYTEGSTNAFVGNLISGPRYKVRSNKDQNPAEYQYWAKKLPAGTYDKDDVGNSYNTATYKIEDGDYVRVAGARQFLDDGVKSTIIVIKDEGFDVAFKKVDGFGNALGGATFTVYEGLDGDLNPTDVKKRGAEDITATSFSEATTVGADASAATYPAGAVYMEKVPTGIWYMMERQVDGASGAPAGYDENEKRYVLLVGDTALARPSAPADGTVWAAGGVLERITQADISAQTGADGKFAIFQLDENGQAIATPDIGAFGIANNAGSGKVMLRKTDGTDYTALEGARFRIFSYSMEEITEGQPTDDSGNRLGYYESTANGVYFIGELPVGRYYLVEMQPPTKVNGTGTAAYDGNTGKVFTLDVTADGAPKQVDTNQKIDLADMPASLKAWAEGEA